MNHIGPETRLTDALERQLMAAAIEEQLRLNPVKAIKAWFAAKFSHKPARPARHETTIVSSANHGHAAS